LEVVQVEQLVIFCELILRLVMTSHALVFDVTGPADQVLSLKEVTKPTIVKDTDVLVRIKAAPINPSDLGHISGYYAIKPKFPGAIPGFEGSGIIEKVGHGVHDLKVGQRVHFSSSGSWSEYSIENSKFLVPLPDSISFEEGAQLSVNPLTILAFFEEFKIKSGDILLQSGAASSLGRILIHFAKFRGIKTINIVRRNEQVTELKEIGADYVINSETENVKDRVREITNGEGVKFAVDPVAGESGSQIVQSLAVGGTLIIYGGLSKKPVEVDPAIAVFRGVTVKGFWLTNWIPQNLEKLPSLYKELIQYLAEKRVEFPSKTFDGKTQFKEAIEHSKSPGKSVKTILLF